MKAEETENTIETQSNQPHEESLSQGNNPDVGEPEVTATPAEPQDEAEKWQREAAEWKDKYMRLFAEFDNFRKRSAKERVDLLSTASADVIKELLPIIDDFERAVKANENIEDVQVVKEGFVLIHQKFYKKLEAKGLKPMETISQTFDTDFHEAITQIPAATEDLKGKVVDELEKGYLLHDKVIRFAKVVIGQ